MVRADPISAPRSTFVVAAPNRISLSIFKIFVKSEIFRHIFEIPELFPDWSRSLHADLRRWVFSHELRRLTRPKVEICLFCLP